MNSSSRKAVKLGIRTIGETGWRIREYLLKSDIEESLEVSFIDELIEKYINLIEKTLLTEEFNYQRVGFVIFHAGRRGVTIAIWHWAEWDGSWELFAQEWYCYGRDFHHMELLDVKEPVLCHHDTPVVQWEIQKMVESIDNNNSIVTITEAYIASTDE